MGELVAVPLLGVWTGNRGNLRRGTEIVRFHRSTLWITCALDFRVWRLPQWAPGRYTVLFFHDEAVALAAGHRPCALCRRADYRAYREAWAAGLGAGVPLAKEIDRQWTGSTQPPRTGPPLTRLSPSGRWAASANEAPAR